MKEKLIDAWVDRHHLTFDSHDLRAPSEVKPAPAGQQRSGKRIRPMNSHAVLFRVVEALSVRDVTKALFWGATRGPGCSGGASERPPPHRSRSRRIIV